MMVWRRLQDLPLLVILMGFGAVIMVVPAAYALVLRDFAVARAFLYSGIILIVLTGMFAIATSGRHAKNAADSQFRAMISAYLVLPIVLAVPVHQAIPDVRFSQAWFEMLSCFTTTGASVFDTAGEVPAAVHLWRSIVGWLGGGYTLVMFASVMAPRGLGGVELISGRASGAQTLRIVDASPRILHFTGALIPVYAALTLLLWLALLLAGDSALVALCHAMGTVSTSGISPVGGLGAAASGGVGELLVFAGLGLAVTRRLWPTTIMADRRESVWQNPELRLTLFLLAVVTVVMSVRFVGMDHPATVDMPVLVFLRDMWGAVFTALSFLTTTGFQSASWPELRAPGLLLVGLAMIGGGVATAAGGVKLMRVYALLRHGERELERIVHPHSIGGHGPVARRLRREGAYRAWIFFMIFGLSLAVTIAALTLTGFGFYDAMVLAIASLTTTGQLAAAAGNTSISYAHLADAPMAVLGVAMVLGRLEILAVFAVIAQKSWVR